MNYLVLGIIALVSVAFLLYVVRGRGRQVDDPAQLLARAETVDLEAFRALIDPADEQLLRSTLPSAAYRQVHRLRVRSALSYLNALAANATILMRLGEAARRSPDAAQAAAGEKLVAAALLSRRYVLTARMLLAASWLFPALPLRGAGVLQAYESLKDQAARTASARDPRLQGRILASL